MQRLVRSGIAQHAPRVGFNLFCCGKLVALRCRQKLLVGHGVPQNVRQAGCCRVWVWLGGRFDCPALLR